MIRVEAPNDLKNAAYLVIQPVGGATRYEMLDEKNKTRTTLTIERNEIDAEIPDRFFSPKRLGEDL